ncbi:ras GEF [Anaeromyces robustus]|uniref:Ras GEF n=1 Tax=Anaeromyces robustus TaxID=1754192 RepID=A0A1Y1X490_9FUNG|nr:ras GEF [Anaeromyces robustus]|eukprot:ORX80630.1 ras GEF [Anaeromyces robustus]
MAFSGGSNFIEGNNGECFLRMKLPDDGTTMINIPSKTITLWDVVCKVAEKKSYVPGDYIILAEKGSKKLKPDLSETLESYLEYTLKLISVEDKNESQNRRRGSIMNSPASKKLNFKMKKYNFPATIDEEQIKKKQQNSVTGSDFNLRIGKSKKSFSLFIFRRSSSTLIDSRLSNNSLQDENNTEDSLHVSEIHESLSGENGSLASINSIESAQNHEVGFKGKDLSLIDIDSGKPDDHTHYTIRKAIVSPGGVNNSNSTLRRNTFRKHQRSQTDNMYLKQNGNTDSNATCTIYILFNDEDKSEFQFPGEMPMDAILSCACKKKELDEEIYTLQSENGDKIQLDRLLKYYTQESNININTFKIIEGEKYYSTVCVNENDQDVMILQYTNDEDLQVMAGTIDKLIERATDDSEKDDTFLDIFLLTYRAYIKPMEFFQLLTARFNCELPPDPSEDDIKYFEDMKGLIQSNVVSVMEYWVKHHWHDFAVYPDLEENLCSFINELKPYEEYTQRVEDFESQIELQKKKYEDMFEYIRRVEKRGKVMQSMLSELDPVVVAEQLCIYDFKLMKNIHPIEYLNQIWGNKDNEDSPCLNFFISRFNLESFWAATEVLSVKDLKKRTETLKKIIQVTKSCLDNNNFFSTFALLSGLSTNAIQRLKKTWEGLSSKVKSTFTEIEKLMDPSRNMRNYRMELESKEPPIIPFLPIYLKDLTFINDGNQSKVENMINFDKLRMMSNRVHDLTSLIDKSYDFKEDPIIQNYLAKPPKVDDDKELKQMSLECEK